MVAKKSLQIFLLFWKCGNWLSSTMTKQETLFDPIGRRTARRFGLRTKLYQSWKLRKYLVTVVKTYSKYNKLLNYFFIYWWRGRDWIVILGERRRRYNRPKRECRPREEAKKLTEFTRILWIIPSRRGAVIQGRRHSGRQANVSQGETLWVDVTRGEDNGIRVSRHSRW